MEQIEQLIRQATDSEASQQQLQALLAQRADQVARVVQLPDQQPQQKLYEFVLRYIEDVPLMLNNLLSAADEVGLSDCVTPITDLACEFFLTPPQLSNSEQPQDLVALMDEAYLAQRLLEEVNEAFIFRVGQPLIPVDMMLSNLIIHSLIGEPFANELDQRVAATVDALFHQPQMENNADFKAFIDRKQADNLIQIGQRWQCLSAEMGLAAQWSA